VSIKPGLRLDQDRQINRLRAAMVLAKDSHHFIDV